MSTFKMGKTLIKSLFRKPATYKYPAAPRAFQEATRGHVEIDVSKCILCSICANKCPADAILVNRDERTWEIERMACVQCRSCVDRCPKQALSMEPDYTVPGEEKIVEIFDIPKTEVTK